MLNSSPFNVDIINEYPDGMVECIIKDKSGTTPDTHAFFNINDCDVFMEPFKNCGFFISSIFIGLICKERNMAVRGQETKNKIIKTITELFPGAFVSGKELRIEAQEGGELVQIKVALTAAKDNIAHGDVVESRDNNSWTAQPHFDEPTPEEIERIKHLMKKFGLE